MKQILFFFLLIIEISTIYNFVCGESNYFFNLVHPKFSKRYDQVDDALKSIETGSTLLILSDGYPTTTTQVSSDQFQTAFEKNITMFIEFPSSFPGLELISPSLSNQYFRTVVNEYPSLTYLKPQTILKLQGKYIVGINNCYDVNCIDKSILVTGRVAGYDLLPFGFPSKNQLQSILYVSQREENQKTPKSIISLTSVVSDSFTARYHPVGQMENMFLEILNFLSPICDEIIIPKYLNTSISPLFSKEEPLPPQANLLAFTNAISYLSSENLLIRPPNPKTKELCIDKPPSNNYSHISDGRTSSNNNNNTCMLSGYETQIDVKGDQPICNVVRIDCVSETSMSLALGGKLLLQNPQLYTSYAENLMDYIYFNSDAQRKSPSTSSYGLISWGIPTDAWFKVFYGDDNARSLISTILTASLLQTSKYDENLLLGVLGNLRTSSYITGFRPHRLDEDSLEKTGWKVHFDDVKPAKTSTPHFDSYLWALFLWTYEKTKGKVFLEMAERGIRTTMDMYFHNDTLGRHWTWTETMTEEQSRMLLPLSWIVRVYQGLFLQNNKYLKEEERTEFKIKYNEYVTQLKKLSVDLLASQEPKIGAIREVFGDLKDCIYCPPKSNEEYGTHESPIIQENGDPASDLLYTSPFAMIGLLEAFYATNDSYYMTALSKLEEFLIRVQVSAPLEHHQKYLNGGWLRSFDFEKWEFWGSSGDVGWGVYSQTTGWTETWISSVIALKELKTSLWDVTIKNSQIDPSLFDKLCPTFFSGLLYSRLCDKNK